MAVVWSVHKAAPPAAVADCSSARAALTGCVGGVGVSVSMLVYRAESKRSEPLWPAGTLRVGELEASVVHIPITDGVAPVVSVTRMVPS